MSGEPTTTTETSVFVCYPDPDPACTNYEDESTTTTAAPVTTPPDAEPVTTVEVVEAQPAAATVTTELAYTGSFELALTLIAVLFITVGTALVRREHDARD